MLSGPLGCEHVIQGRLGHRGLHSGTALPKMVNYRDAAISGLRQEMGTGLRLAAASHRPGVPPDMDWMAECFP